MSLNALLVVLILVGEIALGWQPATDRGTWFFENAPVFVLLALAFWLQPRLRLTRLTLVVLTIHAFVLMLGGHYSYAKVPLGDWMRDSWHLARNPYDRIGHFFQGFTPALALREILIRKSPLKRGLLLGLVVLCMCMTISVFYEFLEWATALALGQGAEAVLATQGDPWDTQWDMFMCLIGATVALVLVRPLQNKLMKASATDSRP